MKYKTTIILILVLFIFTFLVKIPKYVELNHLIIVDTIGVECSNNNITLYLREIIPAKNDNGINYQYKIYKGIGKSIDNAFDEIDNKTYNKIFYKDSNIILSNCGRDEEIAKYFEINKNRIKYSSNIKDIIKKSDTKNT